MAHARFPSIARSTAWNAVNSIAGRVAGLLFWIVLARLLTAEETGQIIAVQSTALTAILLVSTGLSSASTQYVATSVASGKNAQALPLLVGIIISIAMALLLYVGAPAISYWMGRPRELEEPLKHAAVFAFFAGFAASTTGALAGTHGFRQIAVASVAGSVAQLAVLPMLSERFGGLGAIYALVIGQAIVAFGGLTYVLRAGQRFSLPTAIRSLAWGESRDLFTNTIWATGGHAIFHIASWASMALLIRQAQGLEEAAIFGVALQWRQITLFVPTVLMAAFLPIFAARAADEGRRRSQVERYSAAMNAYVALTAILLALLSPLILKMYGPHYVSGVGVFAALQFTALLQGLQSYRITKIQGHGHFRYLVIVNAMAGVAMVAAAAGLAPLGAIGLATAHVLAFLASEVALRLIARLPETPIPARA